MGKQNKKEPLIKINPRQFAGKRNTNACGEELQSFFACLAKSGQDFDDKCIKERKALTACATAAARRPKVVNTINYHLQRISRLMK
ncbi:hypothetical protein Ndes2526B_g01935 [Nannochloris sp. 'desiccata']